MTVVNLVLATQKTGTIVKTDVPVFLFNNASNRAKDSEV